MQKSKHASKANIWLLPFAITLIFVSVISSCKSGKKPAYPTCVKLTKAQVQNWVKKGFTDSSSADYMMIVRFKTAYAFPGTGFRVYAIGQRKDGTFIDGSLTELTAVDTCNKKHINLSEYIFTGTNPIRLSDLNIVKKDGKINDSLRFLQMIPYTYTDPITHYSFLAFDINGTGENNTTIFYLKNPLPCPPCPNCPKYACPPPPTCESCGTDSTESITPFIIDPASTDSKDSVSNNPE